MQNKTLNLTDFATVLIVRCRITGIPGINKQDKSRTLDLAQKNNTTRRHGRVTKTLFADSHRARAIKQIGASVRNWLRINTLPGEADGKYMVMASSFQEVSDKMNEWQNSFNTALDDFVDNLPEEIAHDMRAKQNLFDVDDYPTAEAVRAAASFGWGFEPLPQSTGFSDMFDSAEITRHMEQQHEQHLRDLFESATEVNLERLRGRISASMGQLRRYSGEAGQRLHCSGIVDGMADTARQAAGLNVAKSSEVADLANAMLSWADEYNPCDVLKDANVRERAIRELGQMLPSEASAEPAVPTGMDLPAEEPQHEEAPAVAEEAPAVAAVDVDALSF